MDGIFSAVDQRKLEIARILCELIRFDTSNPPGRHYKEIGAFIRSFLSPLGFSFEEVIVDDTKLKDLPFELEGERVNLIGIGPYDSPPMSFYAHLDVVPAQDGWSHPPFKGVISDDYAIGRGAVDMKGSIACLLFVAQLLFEKGIKPKFNPVGLFCTDEEIGGHPGIYELALQQKIQGPLLWLEGGGQWPVLLTSLLGSAEIHIAFHGTSAHVALPFLGENALERAIRGLVPLLDYKQSLLSRTTQEPLLFFPDQRLGPMMSITMMNAGHKANMIPDTCNIVIDRRFTWEESFERVEEEMRSLIQGDGVHYEAFHFYDPLRLEWDSSWHRKKIEALCKIYGLTSAVFRSGGMGGASDMSFVKKVYPDLPIVGMGVMSPRSKGAHAVDEAVHVDDLAGLSKEMLYMLCA